MFLFLTFLLLAADAPKPKPGDAVVRVSVDEARAALARNDAVLVDVRGEVPFSLQHIRGAVSIPLGLVGQRASELPADKLIVTYCTCTHDDLSIAAVLELQKAGIARAAALHGGFRAWEEAGLPIDRAPADPEAEAAPPARSGRIGPPPAVTCDRNDLTAYNGRVLSFRRTKTKTTIRIATDWDTTETVTAKAPRYLVNGEPMKAADWKRRRIGVAGGRANVWVCRRAGVAPVIDWRSDEQGRTGD